MDHSYPYIASLTREPFLFYEMRSTAKLMAEGNSDDAIVKENVEQNLFQYPTEKSITRMVKACIKRLHALDKAKTDHCQSACRNRISRQPGGRSFEWASRLFLSVRASRICPRPPRS